MQAITASAMLFRQEPTLPARSLQNQRMARAVRDQLEQPSTPCLAMMIGLEQLRCGSKKRSK
jgi:hypothetical protein